MAQILVADDSTTFRHQLMQDLTEAGHTVLQAEDGLDAIKKITEAGHLDLIILDVNMPGATGIQVVEQVHSKLSSQSTLIFMLTTDSSQELKEKGKTLGVKAWITKPYKKEALLGAINKVITK